MNELRGFNMANLYNKLRWTDLEFVEWLSGSTIMSDCWASYVTRAGESLLERLPENFTHLTVNHSYNFVDPDTGAHTQTVESTWQKFKRRHKYEYGTHRSTFRSYVSDFVWRRKFKGEDVLYHLWSQIALLYTGNGTLVQQYGIPEGSYSLPIQLPSPKSLLAVQRGREEIHVFDYENKTPYLKAKLIRNEDEVEKQPINIWSALQMLRNSTLLLVLEHLSNTVKILAFPESFSSQLDI